MQLRFENCSWKRVLIAVALAAIVCPGVFAQSGGNDSTVKDFQERIAKYMGSRKQEGVPHEASSSPAKVTDERKQAEHKIRQSRPSAKQGDIFIPQIAAYFKKQLAETLQGPNGAKVRASLQRAEPLPNVPLSVNQKYPRNLPLQSTPPTLLLNLPRLPNELQYRLVGQTLVLYDAGADLIVDLLPDAIPGDVNKK